MSYTSGTSFTGDCAIDYLRFMEAPLSGCMDPFAFNYDPVATIDDGSCLYPGCMDPFAVNYNASANGTSMATPQVCGLLACAAEQYPNMRQANALQYLIEGAKAQIATTSEDPPTQSPYTSFGDGNNRYVSYVFKRPQSGTVFPHDNHGNRLSSSNGVKYPRVNSVVTKPV